MQIFFYIMISAYSIALYALVPAVVSVAGGVIASIYIPKPGTLRSLQHLVAGVVMAAVSVELLPKILPHNAPWTIGTGFVLGVALMLLLKEAAGFLSHGESSIGLIVGSAIDLLIDGILIGVAFLAGATSGIFIAISLSFCAFFLNLSVSSTLAAKKSSKKVRWLAIFLIAAMLPIGAFIGAAVVARLPSSLLIETLAFAVAALLYLSVEELLAEGHKKQETSWTSSCFFLGFLIILIFKLSGY